MITPALDLQGAPQLIDRIAPETSSADSGGDFGAAFTASLSATRAAAGAPSGKEVGSDVGQKLAAFGQSSQAGGSARTAAAKTASASSKFFSTVAGQRAGIATAASLRDSAEGAGVDAIQKTGEAVASAVAAKPVDASLSGRSGSQLTTGTSTVLSNSQKIALARSEVLGNGREDIQDAAGVASEKPEINGSGSGLTETTKASQSSSEVEGSQSAAKSKLSGQAADKTAAQIALPATNYIPVVTLAVVAPIASPGTVFASSPTSFLKRAEGITATAGTASGDWSAQFAQQPFSAKSAANAVVALDAGTGAGKSGALAAWNSIEPANDSAARGAAGRAHEIPATSAQVESAAEVQSSAETASSASAYPALPGGLLASSLNRSTAVPVSTAFTITGEQRVPSVTNDLSKDGSRTRSELPGVAPLRSVTAHVSPNGSQTVVASSTALLAADAHSGSAYAASTVSKTTGAAYGSTSLETNAAKTGVERSSALARPLTTPGPLVVAKQAPQPSATQALSQNPAALREAGSDLRHASNSSSEQNSPGAAAVPSSQRSTAGGSQAAERAKAIGSAGIASPPAPAASTLVSQNSTDRGVSGEGSGNAVSAHAGGIATVTATDHILPPESSNGAAVASSAISTLSVQGVHQGAGSTSGSTAFLGQGAQSRQGSLSAAVGAELGHPANMLRTAISADPHQTLVATPTALEVGVHSGSQGWLKIRAEVGGEGEVSASLASSSPSGEQMLKGQLPALNAYLHSEQMSVTASVAERTGIAHGAVTHDAGGTAMQAGTGSANSRDSSLLQGGANQGMDGQGNRSQSDARSAAPLQVTRLSDGQTRYEASSDRRVASDAALPSIAADSSGQWLNVRV